MPRRSKPGTPSQLLDLFFHVADTLGFRTNREVAKLADVTVANVELWRKGEGASVKTTTLTTMKAGLEQMIRLGRDRSQCAAELSAPLHSIEIEGGAGPSELQESFEQRSGADYVGHRFLYYEPQGAVTWRRLIGQGYGQRHWLDGVRQCCARWLAPDGPLAEWLESGGRSSRGLDFISLGPGDGEKERIVLEHLLDHEERTRRELRWLSYAPVDVSIPLLLQSAQGARALLAERQKLARPTHVVWPFCADFEEGKLAFAGRLPTATDESGRRLIVLLGNTLGNVRDEATFVQDKISVLARPGDLLWVEVALGHDRIDDDPFSQMNEAEESNRHAFLRGPYERWEATRATKKSHLKVKIWPDPGQRTPCLPGAYNWCHDLHINGVRVCTMLYSRRYQVRPLLDWFDRAGYEPLSELVVSEGSGRTRVAHLLLRRR